MRERGNAISNFFTAAGVDREPHLPRSDRGSEFRARGAGRRFLRGLPAESRWILDASSKVHRGRAAGGFLGRAGRSFLHSIARNDQLRRQGRGSPEHGLPLRRPHHKVRASFSIWREVVKPERSHPTRQRASGRLRIPTHMVPCFALDMYSQSSSRDRSTRAACIRSNASNRSRPTSCKP
jgi:hypothetical protein